MTHAFLQAELTSLISDSKRRHNDIRATAEQSLSDLKSISVTSETQLAGDLCRRPQFIQPFLLACKTNNTKLATCGTACLQRLAASRALARARLVEVLDAFHDAVGAGYEPQLKILQTLPSLLQLYASDIQGNVLAKTLELCAVLQSSKTVAVSNTAAATFQQLVSTVFENNGKESKSRNSHESDGSNPTDGNSQDTLSDDATRVFEDFCLLLDQQKPFFLKIDSLLPGFLLETLQTILSSHDSILSSISNRDLRWSENLVHGLGRSLAKKDNFPNTARALAVLLMLFQSHAENLRDRLLEVVPLLVGALERDGNPPWRRAIFLEFFRNLCSDFNVMREIFTTFDTGKEPVRMVGQLMSALVRIAAEDPSLIGLGRQSTVPIQRTADPKSEEAASIEAQGLGGAITSVNPHDSSTTGISMEWSLIPIPLLDQADKNVAPAIPTTYVYTLLLGCISSFCDGLSKFVMPLSVPSRASQRESLDMYRRDSSAAEQVDVDTARKAARQVSSSQKYLRLVNPLSLTEHRLFGQIRTVAAMVEAFWPAALATCSTFLNAALDSEFYHALIRSVQKLAQVSGVLELSTPRDALLTTLAKSSIPANAGSIIAVFQSAKTGRIPGGESNSVPDGLKSPTETPLTPTFQANTPPLNVRHLLCLRALLNLGIALGATLEQDAWFILIETMQTVEALIAMPSTIGAVAQTVSPRIGLSNGENQTTLATEIAAAQAATKRMLESTKSFGSKSFSDIVQALLRLLGQSDGSAGFGIEGQGLASPTTSPQLGVPRPGQQASRSVSGLWVKSKSLEFEVGFVLAKLSDLSRINIYRFASSAEQSCSWDMIGTRLIRLSQDVSLSESHRVQAASILDLISMETVKVLDDSHVDPEEADSIRSRCLGSFLRQLESFEETGNEKNDSVEMELHKRLLDALESMLSHSGESLSNCWPAALEILSVTFSKRGKNRPQSGSATNEQAEKDAQTAQILRIAFRSIQLIASDFLGVLDTSSLAKLAHLLRQFGSQHYDLNVALTSTTVLWGLASHVLSRIGNIDIGTMETLENEDENLSDLRAPGSAAIWSRILLELVSLCKDHRADVRNAAIRVLLKMLEASGEHISPKTWAVSLKVGPMDIIRHDIAHSFKEDTDRAAWMASVAQLIDGTVQLVCQNLPAIAEHDGFRDTWLGMMDVLKITLDTKSAFASSLAFSNLSKLLLTLPSLESFDEDLVVPAVQLWTDHHPADLPQEVPTEGPSKKIESNQQAFAAHAHVLVEAYKTSSVAVSKLLTVRILLVMESVERGVLLATHPPYTSDVKEMAVEQKEVYECLAILKTLLERDVSEYAGFLLRLLSLTLNVQDGKVVVQPKKSTMSKSIQKPSFIAFAAACLNSFRNLILERASLGNLDQIVVVHNACPILSSIISTKYTSIQVNNQAPLWRNATVTAVVMLEALQKNAGESKSPQGPNQFGMLAPQIIPIAVSILQGGGLSNPPAPEHSKEVILEDETFDVEHFELLHRAVVSIFQQAKAVDEDIGRQYAIVVFHASLLAKPWFYDIPDDLVNTPLEGLMRVRPGSVHRPIFAVRRQICYAALDALFELVHRPDQGSSDEAVHRSKSANQDRSSHKLSCAAAPYLILRVVHPLKIFLADQRLRSLTPPPKPQQVELQTILSNFVDLKSDGYALRSLRQPPIELDKAPKLNPNPSTTSTSHPAPHTNLTDDGKAHLRFLYGMMLRVQRYWHDLPRLEGPGARAWQDEEPGVGIVKALERWQMVLAEGWGVGAEGGGGDVN